MNQQFPQQPAPYTYPQQPMMPPAAPTMAQQGYTYSRRRQSIKVHIWLAIFTAGLGNIAYAAWCRSRVASRYEW